MTADLRRRIATTIAIRDLLLQYDDGLTIQQISAKLNLDPAYAKNILKTEYGFYVDRYTAKKFAAVYCIVEVPENCPLPYETTSN